MDDRIEVTPADLNNPFHGQGILEMMRVYSLDPMVGGSELGDYVKQHLVAELAKRPGTHVFLAWSGNRPVALANCFEGFSTFFCKPLMNIHDLVVAPDFRRRGVSTLLLEAVEARARELGCCKLTLEVLSGNRPAQMAYQKSGFDVYRLDPQLGGAQFWQKKLV